MTALLTGVLLGAAAWAVISTWLAPVLGMPIVFVALFLLAVAWIYLVSTEQTA